MQKNIWRAENFGDTVSEMVFLRDFEARQACIDEHKTGCLDIHNQEPGDPKDDTQYVTYDSGIHGAFTTQEHQNLVRSSFEGRIYFNASILVKMACIYQYEYEGTTNMMVGRVKKVNYSEDNSVCLIEVLQCPPQGPTKDNLSILINYCIRVTDVLEHEMRLVYNTDSGSFSKKRKVGKHGHSSLIFGC